MYYVSLDSNVSMGDVRNTTRNVSSLDVLLDIDAIMENASSRCILQARPFANLSSFKENN